MKARRIKSSRSTRMQGSSLHEWLQTILPAILVAVLILLGYWGYLKLKDPELFPIKKINFITSNNHVPNKVLLDMLQTNWRGSFFIFNSDQLRQAFMQLPWIANISIRRVWPNGVSIEITEQQALATWQQNAVVNIKGERFYPSVASIPKTLPHLAGPDNAYHEVLQKFNNIQEMLAALNLSVQSLCLSKRMAWHLELSNGIWVVLGRYDVDARFNRFIKLYPRLIGSRGDKVAAVDLRYPNGIAIKWRKDGD